MVLWELLTFLPPCIYVSRRATMAASHTTAFTRRGGQIWPPGIDRVVPVPGTMVSHGAGEVWPGGEVLGRASDTSICVPPPEFGAGAGAASPAADMIAPSTTEPAARGDMAEPLLRRGDTPPAMRLSFDSITAQLGALRRGGGVVGGPGSFMGQELSDQDAFRGSLLPKPRDSFSSSHTSRRSGVGEELLYSLEINTHAEAQYWVADRHYRPPRPLKVPPAITELLAACWNGVPSRRPRFDQICKRLDAVLKSPTNNPARDQFPFQVANVVNTMEI